MNPYKGIQSIWLRTSICYYSVQIQWKTFFPRFYDGICFLYHVSIRNTKCVNWKINHMSNSGRSISSETNRVLSVPWSKITRVIYPNLSSIIDWYFAVAWVWIPAIWGWCWCKNLMIKRLQFSAEYCYNIVKLFKILIIPHVRTDNQGYYNQVMTCGKK